jgi:DNA-binding winged helix-turn-helix (wHTH) protein/Tfp pilus assembly protein PilF
VVASVVYSFGPYEIDTAARRLRRGGEAIPVSDRHLDVLIQLVAQPGVVVSKDALVQAGWGDVAVTDNSLEQAISSLRRALADAGDPYIETVPRRGYRFIADVARTAARQDDAALDALLAPHRAWLDGRTALITMEAGRAPDARAAFADALRQSPDYAPAHVGMANACIFQFESTRADLQPDRDALAAAVHHAREACKLDAGYAEAWATLGFALQRVGQPDQALAATRRAASLEPDNWRVMLRLAYVSWGEERLRAAHRVLALLPGLSMAHWLAATVYVARQALDRAEQELRIAAGANAATEGPGQFSTVAVQWLLGLVLLANGDERAATAALRREVESEPGGHLYSRECCANAWYALGALAVRHGDNGEAANAFASALDRVPGHPFALAGLLLLDTAAPERRPAVEARAAAMRHASPVEAALLAALIANARDSPETAVAGVSAALDTAPAGGAGWILPVEPLLDVRRHLGAWAPALARLRSRAV